jgi:diguanylate cyclase (GGDEF)-like protein
VTLRVRLTLAFALVVTVPLVVGALLVARGVPGALDDATRNRLETGRASTQAVLQERCAALRAAAELLGRQAADTSPAAAVRNVNPSVATYAVVADAGGRVIATEGSLPGSIRQPSPSQLGSCTRGTGSPPGVHALAEEVTTQTAAGRPVSQVAVAVPLGPPLLGRLVTASAAEVTLVHDGEVIASTLGHSTAVEVAKPAISRPGHDVKVAGRLAVAAPAPGVDGAFAVVSLERTSVAPLEAMLGAVVLGALLLAGLMGWQLARVTTQPLVELADAAARVAGGDLGTQIGVRSHDEVGRLAVTFNEMTDELRTYIGELESSRDELRRNLARLGDTLSSTHDLGRILTVILETAMASTRAKAGAIFLVALGRDDVYLKVARGLSDEKLPPGTRIPLGEGVTGAVARTGEPVHGRVGPGGLTLSPGEPSVSCLIAEPLKSSGQVIGVLDLYDRADADDFDAGDLDTIRSFASQASVAIDNVLLHQEAQRLSITDGLTGLWNYRYFQMTIGKEVERALRFDRPLALLMLDLDHFKRVNDEHGHQRGDAVLVEFARRVKSQVREVDVLARYGGEELVCVLPETDRTGAEHTAARICTAVRAAPFDGGLPLTVTVSVGVAVFPEHGRTGADLIRAADNALYAAKNAGRDQWRTAVATASLLEPNVPTPQSGSEAPARQDT